MTWVARGSADVVRVSGKDRVDLLHRLSTNDVLPLATTGAVRSTLFTTAQGRLIDWVTALATDDVLLLVCSPGRGARVAEWIETYTIMEDVKSVVTTDWALIEAQGPASEPMVGGDLPARGLAAYRNGEWLWRGVPAFGDRVEMLVASDKADDVIDRIVAAGAVRGDAVTVEMARVLAGVPGPLGEYPDDVNPLELRLGPEAVSFRKGCYIGQEVISRLDSYDKVARLLVGFTLPAGESIPSDIADIKLTREGRPFGRVTSLVQPPHGEAHGLAVVKREGADEGTAELVLGERSVPVRVSKRPFPG